jgi:hypothetical protein
MESPPQPLEDCLPVPVRLKPIRPVVRVPIKLDVSALKGLGATPAQDPSPALATAKTDLGNANAAVTWAQQQGNAIDTEADQLATTAENFESQQGC